MHSAINSMVSGVLVGVMAVVFATSYASMIFAGDLAVYLPNGIGIALASATIIAATVALMSSYPSVVANPQDINSVVFGVAAAAIAAAMSSQTSGEAVYATVVTALVLTAVVTGVACFALGYFRLGGLVRFIPYPVIGGFLAATGWLLVQAAVALMAEVPVEWSTVAHLLEPATAVDWLPGMAFGVVLFAVTRRYTHHFVFPSLLVGSIVVFHLVLIIAGISVSDAGARGWLLGPFPEGAVQMPVDPSFFISANWQEIFRQLPSVGTIVLLTVIGLLLNASALEIAVNRDIDLNRELRAAGLGNLLAAFGGGMSGYQYLSLSVLSHRMRGDSRLVGLSVAAVCAITFFAGASALSFFPKLVLGGVIAYLGIGFLVEWLYEARRRLPAFEHLVIILIFIVAGAVGFLEAVAAGVLASTVLFIINYSRVVVVRHALSGRSYRSNVARSEDQARMLRESGRVLLNLRLQGFIFFGTAFKLFEDVQSRARRADDPVRFVVMDFSMVNGVDSSAVMSFIKMGQLAQTEGLTLVFTHLSPGLRRQMAACGFSLDDQNAVRTFADFDHGVEWCEDELLKRQGVNPEVEREALFDTLRQMLPTDLDVADVMTYLERQEADEGQYLIRQGDAPDDFFLIESGRVTVQLELDGGDTVRLLSTGLGTVGEAGLYTGEARTASVVTDEPSVVYRVTLDALQRMENEQPKLAAAFHKFIARRLAVRLADTTRVLREVMK